jgi:hypothetical protein
MSAPSPPLTETGAPPAVRPVQRSAPAPREIVPPAVSALTVTSSLPSPVLNS